MMRSAASLCVDCIGFYILVRNLLGGYGFCLIRTLLPLSPHHLVLPAPTKLLSLSPPSGIRLMLPIQTFAVDTLLLYDRRPSAPLHRFLLYIWKCYQQMKTSDMFNHTLLPFPIAFAFCLQYRMTGCLHLSGGIPYEAPKSNLAVYNLGLRCEAGGSGSDAAKLLPIIANCRCGGHTTL